MVFGLILFHSQGFVLWISLPVVPHKALAEVWGIANYRRGELLRCKNGRPNPLMDRKVVGASAYLSVYLPALIAFSNVTVDSENDRKMS